MLWREKDLLSARRGSLEDERPKPNDSGGLGPEAEVQRGDVPFRGSSGWW